MYFDFAGFLFLASLVTGLLYFADLLYFKKRRGDKQAAWPLRMGESLFPVFIIVFLIRTFIGEPYRIPSGSMKPTLLEGDFVLVSKFNYGWYFPYIDKRLRFGNVDRGDILIFRYPPDPKTNFVKRVIGLPGDRIVYQNKTLFINGELVPKEYIESTYIDNQDGHSFLVREFTEELPTHPHKIYEHTFGGKDFEGTVPEGYYFVMGDNRDDSGDSRFWGYVPDKYVKGKPWRVAISVDPHQYQPRFSRWGMRVD